jgi:Ca2+-binding RTX toxin-like protein
MGTAPLNVINGTELDDRFDVGRIHVFPIPGNEGLGEEINGLGGDDSIRGFGGDDLLNGGSGADTLHGEGGEDTLNGGGADTLTGGSHNDSISGGPGSESIEGGSGIDTLIGGGQADTLRGGDGADSMLGGDGSDFMRGGAGDDLMDGDSASATDTSFRNTMFGDAGDDTMRGFVGNDVMNGGDDDDRLDGGGGRDVLTGGAGQDVFRWDSVNVDPALHDSFPSAAARDLVTDFDTGSSQPVVGYVGDKLDFSAFDARPDLLGDQALSFIGTAGFTANGFGGEVRFLNEFVGSPLNGGEFRTRVQVELNGDGVADLEVSLSGRLTLIAENFVL